MLRLSANRETTIVVFNEDNVNVKTMKTKLNFVNGGKPSEQEEVKRRINRALKLSPNDADIIITRVEVCTVDNSNFVSMNDWLAVYKSDMKATSKVTLNVNLGKLQHPFILNLF